MGKIVGAGKIIVPSVTIKAKDLAKRVNSYFAKPRALAPAKQIMVQRISDIETIVVASEQEALLLEANLIKRHLPPFNIVMRDDRSFVYVQVDHNPPQVRATRFPQRGEGRRVFGPYASADTVYQTLRALKAALVGSSYLPGLFVVLRRGQLLPPLGQEDVPVFIGQDQVQAAAAAVAVATVEKVTSLSSSNINSAVTPYILPTVLAVPPR